TTDNTQLRLRQNCNSMITRFFLVSKFMIENSIKYRYARYKYLVTHWLGSIEQFQLLGQFVPQIVESGTLSNCGSLELAQLIALLAVLESQLLGSRVVA